MIGTTFPSRLFGITIFTLGPFSQPIHLQLFLLGGSEGESGAVEGGSGNGVGVVAFDDVSVGGERMSVECKRRPRDS